MVTHLVEDDKLDLALDIMAKAKAKGVNLVLGCDCVAADAFANDAHTQVCDDKNIPDGWMGLDAGPKTREEFKLLSRVPRLSCGTVLPVYSKWTTSLVVLKQSQKQSQKLLKKVLSH